MSDRMISNFNTDNQTQESRTSKSMPQKIIKNKIHVQSQIKSNESLIQREQNQIQIQTNSNS